MNKFNVCTTPHHRRLWRSPLLTAFSDVPFARVSSASSKSHHLEGVDLMLLRAGGVVRDELLRRACRVVVLSGIRRRNAAAS